MDNFTTRWAKFEKQLKAMEEELNGKDLEIKKEREEHAQEIARMRAEELQSWESAERVPPVMVEVAVQTENISPTGNIEEDAAYANTDKTNDKIEESLLGSDADAGSEMDSSDFDPPSPPPLDKKPFSKVVQRIKGQRKEQINDPDYECLICSKRFSTSKGLYQHGVVHKTGRPFQCPHCPQRFKWKHLCNRHVQVLHSDLKPFDCLFCDRSFKRYFDLELHTQLHTGERPYSCEICEEAFGHSGHLERHIRTHQGEEGKLYQCPFCSRKFTQKIGCAIHQQYRHQAEKVKTRRN